MEFIIAFVLVAVAHVLGYIAKSKLSDEEKLRLDKGMSKGGLYLMLAFFACAIILMSAIYIFEESISDELFDLVFKGYLFVIVALIVVSEIFRFSVFKKQNLPKKFVQMAGVASLLVWIAFASIFVPIATSFS